MLLDAVLAAFAALAVGTACIGTTGSELVTFRAFASGPADMPPDTPARGLSFVNGQGWSITLKRAKKPERFTQTMTAMFGVNSLIVPIVMPFAICASSGPMP